MVAQTPQIFVASWGLYNFILAFPGMVDSILQEQHGIEQCHITQWDVLKHQDYSLLHISPRCDGGFEGQDQSSNANGTVHPL